MAVVEATLHQLGVACPKRQADKDACTQADTVDKQDRQRHQRVGGAHGGKGILAHEFADNDAVHGVIGQLEQVAQHKGNGEIDQQRCDRAGRHIFGHLELSFLVLKIEALPSAEDGQCRAAGAGGNQLCSGVEGCTGGREAGMASVARTRCAARLASVLVTAATLSTT